MSATATIPAPPIRPRLSPPYQGDLFVAPAPAQRHSDTSLDSAQAIEPASKTLRRQVLEFLRGRGAAGATDEEMQEGLGMNPSTQRPRRVELVRSGHIEPAGTSRETRSGRRAVVWRVKG